MTDANDKLTMPPGFRWAPTFEFSGSETVPTGYGYLESSAICTQPIAYTTASRSVVIAHAIVRPAVEAATAELRAERDQARAEGYQTALELEQWQLSHPWSVGEDGDPVTDPHVVRKLWEASERELRARAEKAEARIAAALGECAALEDGEGADYAGEDRAFRQAAIRIRRALGDTETLADRGEGE